LALRSSSRERIEISIVGLAGAEPTKSAADARMREKCNINRSMMVLGGCIRSLAQHQPSVPYRESLVTRLFKDLVKSPGKCAVVTVIVNMSANVGQFQDAISRSTSQSTRPGAA
jgi:hypothetical protein